MEGIHQKKVNFVTCFAFYSDFKAYACLFQLLILVNFIFLFQLILSGLHRAFAYFWGCFIQYKSLRSLITIFIFGKSTDIWSGEKRKVAKKEK